VDGFSDTVHRTGVEAHNGFVNSMTAQAEWRSDFVTERERVFEHAKLVLSSTQLVPRAID
jgi:hypothetical protein